MMTTGDSRVGDLNKAETEDQGSGVDLCTTAVHGSGTTHHMTAAHTLSQSAVVTSSVARCSISPGCCSTMLFRASGAGMMSSPGSLLCTRCRTMSLKTVSCANGSSVVRDTNPRLNPRKKDAPDCCCSVQCQVRAAKAAQRQSR